MLESLRNATKTWVVKLLFALLVLSFLAWGVEDVVRDGLFGRSPAIQVGDVQVTAVEVNSEFKREVERLQPLFGGKLNADEARKLGLLDRTIDNIVTRTLIEEASRRLGLAASDDAVIARVAADPSFRNELGQFDRDLLRRALGRAGLSEKEFMRLEKNNLIRSQMAEALAGGLAAPKTLVDPLVRWREEKRVAEAVVIRDDASPLPAAPDAATLEGFYKANAERFMAPEFRSLSVLLLKPADVAAEIEITPEMLAEVYQARLNEFVTYERRQVSQIVLLDEAAAAKAEQLVKAGKDLPAIAKEVNVAIIDLGIVEKGDLPEELADPVFAVRQGAVTAPVKTGLGGWHVAKVSAITPGRTRSPADVKALLEQDLRREKSHDRLRELANQVEDNLASGAPLEETAGRFNLKLVKLPAIDARGMAPNGKPVADAPKGETFLDVAFHTEQGTESQLTEIENEGYFLVRIDQITPPQPKPLAEMRGEAIAAWQAERRHELAEARARKIAEDLKAGESAAKVAAANGVKIDTTAAFTREAAELAKLPGSVVAEMFKGATGTVATGAAQGGWVVARLAKVIPFDPAQQPKATEAAAKRVAGALSGDLIDQYIAALHADIGVKVDRSQVSREE